MQSESGPLEVKRGGFPHAPEPRLGSSSHSHAGTRMLQTGDVGAEMGKMFKNCCGKPYGLPCRAGRIVNSVKKLNGGFDL